MSTKTKANYETRAGTHPSYTSPSTRAAVEMPVPDVPAPVTPEGIPQYIQAVNFGENGAPMRVEFFHPVLTKILESMLADLSGADLSDINLRFDGAASVELPEEIVNMLKTAGLNG